MSGESIDWEAVAHELAEQLAEVNRKLVALGADDTYAEDEDKQPERSSWEPVDLTVAVAGGDVDAPELLCRVDGTALLYRGRVHSIQGESESLKSWLVLFGVAQVLAVGGRALWIDFEDDARGVVARLRALGVSAELLLSDQFAYVHPNEPLYDRFGRAASTSAHVAFDGLLRQAWDLVAIDGVTEAMTTEGLSLLDNADVASWSRRLPRKFAARGAAVPLIDHVTKNRETQGRYAIGAQQKLAGITGAVYKVTATKAVGRADHEPVTGYSTITVEKDRPGWVRGRNPAGTVAELELTAWPDGGVTIRLNEPRATTGAPRELQVSILTHLAIYDGSSKSAIEDAVTGNATTIRRALAWLVGQGWVEVRKVGNAHRHHLTDVGRAELAATPDEDVVL